MEGELHSIEFLEVGSIAHTFSRINSSLNEFIKGEGIEVTQMFPSYDASSQVAFLFVFYRINNNQKPTP